MEISPSISIDDSEISYTYIRSSGPGGQNVNKVATAVQLRFDVSRTNALSGEVKERLIQLAGSRMTEAGVIVIEAKRFRSQESNRRDAEDRLVQLVQRALATPRDRIPTRPSRTSKITRVRIKKQQGEKKKNRAWKMRTGSDE